MSNSSSDKDKDSKDAYSQLGIDSDASFEAVQKARDQRLSEAGDDLILRAKIESSFDSVLMDSLKARRLGKVSTEAVSASQKEKNGIAGKSGFATTLLKNLNNVGNSNSSKDNDSNKYFNLSRYNNASLHKESDLFFNWYLLGVLGKKKSIRYKSMIKKELNKIYKKIFFKNQFIVHRDFHVSNIMPKNNRLGIIDTQDAILGNPMYDPASLIDDVRIKVPNKVKTKTYQYYIKNCSIKKKQIPLLKNDFDILSIQRNLKILGIFYRLFKRDNKPQYLKYLPYTWSLIELRMKNKIFNNLKKILKNAVNNKIRKKINFK